MRVNFMYVNENYIIMSIMHKHDKWEWLFKKWILNFFVCKYMWQVLQYTGDQYKWLSIGLCMLDPIVNQFCCHRNLYMDSFWCRNSHKTLTMKTTDLKYITLKKNEIKILFRETRFRISLKIFLRVKIISWSTA